MDKKLECPNGVPEEMCDHAPHCNVWKMREIAKKKAQKTGEPQCLKTEN